MGKQYNHEVWVTCPVCGEEYDLRGVHVCEPVNNDND